MFPAIALGIFSGFPVAFSLLGVAFLFGVIGFGDGVIPLGVGLTYKVATSYVLAAVPLFVFMGCLLASTRITDGLLVAAESWVGHFKGGGVAIATILVCIIFAASTGIIGSAEIVIGLAALSTMLPNAPSAAASVGAAIPNIIVPITVKNNVSGGTKEVSVTASFSFSGSLNSSGGKGGAKEGFSPVLTSIEAM